MTLSLYVARRFLWMVARVLAGFWGLMFLIDSVDQIRRADGARLGIGEALHLAALNVPESLYRILPLIVILSAVALFLGLARSSELVIVRAAGRSGLRFVLAPVSAAVIFGLVAVAVLNPLVAATSKQYDALRQKLTETGGASITSVAENGLWLRQGGAEGQTVIQAARANADGTVLYDVTFLTFGPEGRPTRRISAAEAELGDGAWLLRGAKSWDLDALNPEQAATLPADGTTIDTNLTPARIRDSFGAPQAVPVWQLPSFIRGLERAGFAARSYRVWLQMELAQPLLLAAMVLVAAGFTMRHSRFGGTGRMVLFAITAGFAIFFLRNFAQVLGDNGQIPVALAAWSPPLVALLLALGLLLHLEEG